MKVITVMYDDNIQEAIVVNDDVNHEQIVQNLRLAAASRADNGEFIKIRTLSPNTYDDVLHFIKTV
jgi:hypothetical protein